AGNRASRESRKAPPRAANREMRTLPGSWGGGCSISPSVSVSFGSFRGGASRRRVRKRAHHGRERRGHAFQLYSMREMLQGYENPLEHRGSREMAQSGSSGAADLRGIAL